MTTITNPELRQYIETALWSSHDDEGAPLDDSYGIEDMAPETIESMRADLEAFMADEELADALNFWREFGTGQAGHDFWLTRCGHGTGFWDRFSTGKGEEYGRQLTEAAKPYGESYLYIGDDGQIYIG